MHTLNIPIASASFSGLLTASSQNIGGLKQFNNNISLGLSGTTTGSIVLFGSGVGSGSLTITRPTGTASYTLTLPSTAGSNGQVLATNGSGVTY